MRHRTRQIVALNGITADLSHELELRLGLDALGDDLHVKVVRQMGDGDQDRRSRAILEAAFHKRAVDLDAVDGQLTQMSKRGVAGAEVIQGHRGAGCVQAGGGLGGALGIGQHGRLGELDLQ